MFAIFITKNLNHVFLIVIEKYIYLIAVLSIPGGCTPLTSIVGDV
jgi:hypothetical protein